jgi:hypothetical protein
VLAYVTLYKHCDYASLSGLIVYLLPPVNMEKIETTGRKRKTIKESRRGSRNQNVKEIGEIKKE